MRGSAILFASLLSAALLAGCSGSSEETGSGIDKDKLPEPTKTTGILVGVVVDVAIKPIPDAQVTLSGPANATTTSDAEGVFTFGALPPGPYLVSVTRLGFFPVQVPAIVEANVADPEAVRVTLNVDLATTPTAAQFTFDGFIQCSVTYAVETRAVCATLQRNGVPIGQEDAFLTYVPVDRVPTFLQHELVWSSTQTTGNMFQLVARSSTLEQHDEGTYEARINQTTGTSPLILPVNATQITEFELGVEGMGLLPTVFAGGMEGSQVCDPTNSNFGGLAVQNCTFGTGATVEQKFTLYTTIFYGYEPPAGWTFAATSEVPPPPQ